MFHGLFSNREDVFSEFCVQDTDKDNIIFLFAAYDYEDYSGSAMVVFIQNGKFFVVEGSHCSCYGLEEQWQPGEMDLNSLVHMAKKAEAGYFRTFSREILMALDCVSHLDSSDMEPQDVQMYVRLALG